MHLRIVHSGEQPEECTGEEARLIEVAASAIAPHVPAGVAGRGRYAELGALQALREGAYSLPGLRVEFTDEAA